MDKNNQDIFASEQITEAPVQDEEPVEETLQDIGYSPSEVPTEEIEKIIANIPHFTNLKYATSGCLKIMDGKAGGGFFIRYLQDEGSMRGWLELTIVYPDESYRKILLYKNAFRPAGTDCNGVYMRPSKDSKDFVVERLAMMDADTLFLHQFERPDMPIPVKALVGRIKDNYERIPIRRIHESSTLMEVYLDLFIRAKEYSNSVSFAFMDEQDRFFIPTGDFNEIVAYHGWNKNSAKIAFDTMGLLISDKSPTSYQLTKRVRGKLTRFYVFRKKLPEIVTPPLKAEETSFEKDFTSKQEKEIAELKERNEELCKEILSIRTEGKGLDPGVLL